MAIYHTTDNDRLRLIERPVYGGSRLGIVKQNMTFLNGGILFKRDTFSVGLKNYELTDHLGNVTVTFLDRKYGIFPDTTSLSDYYPFGFPMPDRGENLAGYRFGFNGQESDNEVYGDKESYAFEFRNYDARLGRWWGIDPMWQKYPSLSPYAYCGNNPLNRVDPTGMSDSPIYDTDGNLLGTDDNGLQGNAIIMNKDNFKQGMSYEDAMKHNLGLEGLTNQDAMDRYTTSFEGLKDRPDWDGYLTLSEANNWYRNGNGQPLFVDLSKIDLSGLASLGEKYVGQHKYISLFAASNSTNDALVYGTIGLTRYPNNQVRGTYDIYDFDMHEGGGITTWLRNRATEIGQWVAGGKGTAYRIYFNGSKTLKPLWPWTK